MYFRCFKKFQLTHWCHIDYVDDVIISFLDKDRIPYTFSMEGQLVSLFIFGTQFKMF